MSAEIRIRATAAECAEAVKRLHEAFTVLSVSQQFRDAKPPGLVRVYVEVQL